MFIAAAPASIPSIITSIASVATVFGVAFGVIAGTFQIRKIRSDNKIAVAAAKEVAHKAAEAAVSLTASQTQVASKAAEAAVDLIASQKVVADTLVVANAKTNSKLDVIHALVNSNMTTAMQSELDATVRELAMMREVVALNGAAGRPPSEESLGAIDATQTKINELKAALADRAEAAQRVVSDAGAGGSSLAAKDVYDRLSAREDG
ncbi:MAG: hypothetical protein ABSG46_20295 [Candidatus Binataceae bacterium]|jgi:hypothetical protein